MPQESSEREWRGLSTFDGLLKLNNKRLSSGQTCPFHMGEVNDSVAVELRKLNELGLFTFANGSFQYSETGIQRKPYISFLVTEENHASELLRWLLKDTDIEVVAAKLNPFEVKYGHKEFIVERQSGSDPITIYAFDPSDEALFKLDVIQRANLWAFDVLAKNWDEHVDVVRKITQAMGQATARNFDDLLQLNEASLQENRQHYFDGEVSTQLASKLLKLQNSGLLVIHTQEYQKSEVDELLPFMIFLMANKIKASMLAEKLQADPLISSSIRIRAKNGSHCHKSESTEGVFVCQYEMRGERHQTASLNLFESGSQNLLDMDLKCLHMSDIWLFTVWATSWGSELELVDVVASYISSHDESVKERD